MVKGRSEDRCGLLNASSQPGLMVYWLSSPPEL